MLKLSDLAPLNLEEEKEKFWNSGFRSNPQFIYKTAIDQTKLAEYGLPNWWHLFLAKRIVKKFKSQDMQVDYPGAESPLDQASITQCITQRLSHYQLANSYSIVFSKNFVSRIAVNTKDKTIKLRLPVTIRNSEIEAMLNHEIDTHIIRQINYETQVWYKKKKKYRLVPHIRTEEGLAVVNELIDRKSKLVYKSAINYIAVALALKGDFVSVFTFLNRVWNDPDRAWLWTVKKKRGITDTSQKGAYTKDIVYFEGFLQVIRYLRSNQYNPSKLYLGKIDTKDIQKVEQISQKDIVLPLVFLKDRSAYAQKVQEMIRENLFGFPF